MTKTVTPEIFWSRVAIGDAAECWDYIGPAVVSPSGHRRVNFGGRRVYAHRLSFLLSHGHWPELACHTCDRPQCVNPSHLYSGSPQDNVADRDRRGRRTPYLPRRPHPWSSRLTQRDLDELAEAKPLGIRVAVLAEEYQVSASTIRAVWRTLVAQEAA